MNTATSVEAGIMPWDSDFDVKLYTEQDITMEGPVLSFLGLDWLGWLVAWGLGVGLDGSIFWFGLAFWCFLYGFQGLPTIFHWLGCWIFCMVCFTFVGWVRFRAAVWRPPYLGWLGSLFVGCKKRIGDFGFEDDMFFWRDLGWLG